MKPSEGKNEKKIFKKTLLYWTSGSNWEEGDFGLRASQFCVQYKFCDGAMSN